MISGPVVDKRPIITVLGRMRQVPCSRQRLSVRYRRYDAFLELVFDSVPAAEPHACRRMMGDVLPSEAQRRFDHYRKFDRPPEGGRANGCGAQILYALRTVKYGAEGGAI